MDDNNLAESNVSNYFPKENSFSGQSFNQSAGRPKKKATFFIILGIIILFVVGFILLNRQTNKPDSTTAPYQISTPAPTSMPVPTETPKETLVRSKWSFEVLNGSGSTGLAKKISDQLKSLGYQVLKTGNADRNDYIATEIIVRKDLAERVNLVIADLKDVVKIASYGGELKDSTASARIVLGKDLI